ncbi:hypothetical protein JYU34_001357 [Plutella xylostella]|uniref:Uncharacterized protein n=1 Tax=Plutella xylostella TaxID=51655 RepID=A0ABQ7R3Q5_PLUXY|nr:hypothetical protein JYU34_001357 [Plutella xylostella]
MCQAANHVERGLTTTQHNHTTGSIEYYEKLEELLSCRRLDINIWSFEPDTITKKKQPREAVKGLAKSFPSSPSSFTRSVLIPFYFIQYNVLRAGRNRRRKETVTSKSHDMYSGRTRAESSCISSLMRVSVHMVHALIFVLSVKITK